MCKSMCLSIYSSACAAFLSYTLAICLHINQNAEWLVGVMQRDPNEWAWEPLALIAYLLFFRILVYIALRKRTKASVR